MQDVITDSDRSVPNCDAERHSLWTEKVWALVSARPVRLLQVSSPLDGGVARPGEDPVVEVRRSARRTRTVSAYRDKGRIVVLVPARLTAAEEAEWVNTMVEKVRRRERRTYPDDDALMTRAGALSASYLDGLATPASVRWVDNQQTRWGSCTPADGTVRLSRRLLGMPDYVINYVLLHELTHLLVPGHGPGFWEWVNRFPMTERARGFLDGASMTTHLQTPSEDCSEA